MATTSGLLHNNDWFFRRRGPRFFALDLAEKLLDFVAKLIFNRARLLWGGCGAHAGRGARGELAGAFVLSIIA